MRHSAGSTIHSRCESRARALLGSRASIGTITAPGFLNGIAGVGLAFLAATTSIEPAWDRILAAGLPVVR